MAPALTNDLDGVLRSLVALYGDGQPAGQAASVTQALAADLRAHSGAVALRYGEAQGMQLAVAESHAGKDGIVRKAVGESGDGTVNGRGRLTNHIADFQARMQAIASVGDTRFSGPALLDAAQTTISNATKQVNADVVAARQQAAQIMPPAVPATRQARHGTAPRRRRRTRSRTRSASRLRRNSGVRSDGTLGGSAVSAASNWLGTPYVWGGGGAGGPSGGGFDCSGLTQYAIAQASNGEVVLPRTTYEQIYSGVRVHPDDVRAGDLVFPGSSFSTRGPEHVQLAAGNGMVIEAPYTGSVVKWSRMDSNSVVVRVL
ncbi:C40 family peptidase [Nocardia abscessus]|uniref:C40 family peptidase n=1 Tax=Nocardia abscessus TaxID=120957 RepID=UPI000304059A|nr:NlpC/P60 family protein [Nocardia abscessus]MCC3326379.1 C40 family peptidase [Nocardia abscessus]